MDGWITIGTELDTKSFDKQIKLLERQLNDYISDLEAMSKEEGFNEQKQDVLELQKNIEVLTNKIGKLKEKQAELNKQGIPDISQMTADIGNKTENIIKKVAKWGLAIFSVRSAYMFIRQSISTLSQYNDKMATDIEYIRYALASSLQPIIENIIQLIYKMLAYINYISQAWFGINIFANASAKAFGNVKKNLGGANKQAKELQKTLAGFDEMNILQDGSTTKGGGGITMPSMDLANMEDIPIPSWIKWIAENGPTVALILGSIGAALLGIKLVPFLSGLLGITEGLVKFKAGISLVLSGLVLLVGEVINLVLNWDQLDSKQKALAIGIAGLGAALVTLGLTITGLSGGLSLLITGLTALAAALVTIIIKNNENEKSTLSVAEAEKKLKNARENLNTATNNYSNALKNVNDTQKKLEEAEKKAKQSGKELYNQVMLGIIDFDNMSDTQKDLYFKYLDNIEAEAKYKKKTDELREANDKAAGAEQQKAAAVYASTGKYTDYFNTLIKGYEDGKVSSQKMQNVITNIMTQLDDETRETFAQSLPDSIKTGFQKVLDELGITDLKIKDASSGITISYKDIASSTKKTFEKDVPNSLSKTNTALDKTINKVNTLNRALGGGGNLSFGGGGYSGGGSRNAKGAVYYPPKLATGGIINMPGRGVPLAVGGERGAEGVIPLTDSQMMQQLGEAIGRNVVINTILNNYMNSRLISREQQKTSNVDKFAFNG